MSSSQDEIHEAAQELLRLVGLRVFNGNIQVNYHEGAFVGFNVFHTFKAQRPKRERDRDRPSTPVR